MFKKNIPLTLFVTFACERELETEQRLQHNDLTSPSWHSRVSFSFSWCSTGGPGAQLSADFSGPLLTDFLSSPSYIIVQSPTQSLEWHVWSSSSGNNCHVVQRSLSSGASVYECIMGFYLVPFRQPNPPTRFLSITGQWNVSLPSSASLWNGMFGRVQGQYTTVTHNHIIKRFFY